MNMSLSKLQELVKDKEAWHVAVHEVTKSPEQQQQHYDDNNHRTPWEHKMVMADSIKCQLPMEESLLSFESSSSVYREAYTLVQWLSTFLLQNHL